MTVIKSLSSKRTKCLFDFYEVSLVCSHKEYSFNFTNYDLIKFRHALNTRPLACCYPITPPFWLSINTKNSKMLISDTIYDFFYLGHLQLSATGSDRAPIVKTSLKVIHTMSVNMLVLFLSNCLKVNVRK